MIGLTSPYLWYLTRATGIVTLLLFTSVMVVGIMTATRVGGKQLPKFAVMEVHRRISFLAISFLGLHILTSLVDSYVNIGILGVFIPYTSPYKPTFIALGTLSLDITLAVIISSVFKNRISRSLWRTIHWMAYIAWPVAILHSVFIGTDIRFIWMDLFVGLNVAAVGAAIVWRIQNNPRPRGARTAVAARTAIPKSS